MKYVLNESFKSLVQGIFNQDKEKSERLIKAFEELVNDRATTTSLNLEVLKQEFLEEARKEFLSKSAVELEMEKLKNQLITKADMYEILKPYATKADIAEVKREIAETRTDLLKWFVATQVAVGGFVVALIKLFQ
ncbi:hypothetical protein LS74_001085 [Helicobacter magdeburgensis]|uniref:DUF1640 domain-containing protein n=1 Tax=Helicobacter magdeburgensis TaxID=471858 RepID=A0A4U8T233_9HELI|nr:hypothetical protein [Helicobacter magdeburgensis]TLD93354.1 hypothetical protein LS74_001085 [Helicobacter magdeburgensis]